MSLVFFPCCVSSSFLGDRQSAAKVVAGKLGVEIEDVSGFNCCGYPYKGIDFKAFILMSGRALALAEKKGADLVTNCACCYGTLKQAKSVLKEDLSLFEYVNNALHTEGLAYTGNSTAKHLLEVLYESPGVSGLKLKLGGTLRGLKVAAHYGCKMLRPRSVVDFDDPFSPGKFDELIEATGAESVSWLRKLDCCGAPLIGINDTTAMQLAKNKFESAVQAKADVICTACPYCYLQFDRARDALAPESRSELDIPSLSFVQLLGLALGIDGGTLGIDGVKLPVDLLSRSQAPEGEASTLKSVA